MAASLRSKLICPTLLSPKLNRQKPTIIPIRCGPRSNRGPLVKGRILSTEAILTIQSLKRTHNKSLDPTTKTEQQQQQEEQFVHSQLTRLIKSDVLAVLRELLRQNHSILALRVLSTYRSEYPDHLDLNLFADVINSLVKNRMFDGIDELVGDLEGCEGVVQWGNDKGLVRVIKGVIEAGRKESTVRIYEMMRRSGVGNTWTADDYLVQVLSRGLRRFGEVELASAVEREFRRARKGNLEKLAL